MNAFEDIVASCLEDDGYWVRQHVKVRSITAEDKCYVDNRTMPTPEIDIVAWDVKGNELLLIEVKSFLDSQGVYFDIVADEKWPNGYAYENSKHYRLLNDKKYRERISQRLFEEYLEKGLVNSKTKVSYGLAAGKIHAGDEEKIEKYFVKRQWHFFNPQYICNKVRSFSKASWDDNLISVTSKLVCRGG